VTVLALEWEGTDNPAEAPVVHTRSLGDEVFASTIQASLAANEAPPEELDDAEIERSIREINEAIKRSSHKKP
jgi:PPM family protein phosphatase